MSELTTEPMLLAIPSITVAMLALGLDREGHRLQSSSNRRTAGASADDHGFDPRHRGVNPSALGGCQRRLAHGAILYRPAVEMKWRYRPTRPSTPLRRCDRIDYEINGARGSVSTASRSSVLAPLSRRHPEPHPHHRKGKRWPQHKWGSHLLWRRFDVGQLNLLRLAATVGEALALAARGRLRDPTAFFAGEVFLICRIWSCHLACWHCMSGNPRCQNIHVGWLEGDNVGAIARREPSQTMIDAEEARGMQ